MPPWKPRRRPPSGASREPHSGRRPRESVTTVSCPQCGATVPNADGPVHAYVPSAPGCWAAFGALRADEALRFSGSEANNLVVDDYMAQHPGDGTERRDRQSVFVHLVSLCAVVEREASPSSSPVVLRAVLARQATFPVLHRAHGPGDLTVLSAMDAIGVADHDARVHAWAVSVWESWRDHHSTIRRAFDDIG
jgi:hypothetical protein